MRFLIFAILFFLPDAYAAITPPAFNYYSISGKTEDTTPAAGDFVLSADVSATALKKVQIGKINPTTTKGDISVFSTIWTRLPVGTDSYVLQADSAAATGLSYINATSAATASTVVKRNASQAVAVLTLNTTAGTPVVYTDSQQLRNSGGAVIADWSGGTLQASRGLGIGNTSFTNTVSMSSKTSGASAHSVTWPGSNSVGLMQNTAAGVMTWTSSPVLGTAGSLVGTLGLSGATSGVVTVKTDAAAGTYDFILPTSLGSSGQVLTSGGSGVTPTWTTPITNPMTTTGDMIYSSDGSGTAARLAKGTQYQVLTGGATIPTWTAVALDQASAVSGALPIGNGGTGLTAGTSGGIPYFSSTSTIASSGALTASQLVLGGGAGATPTSLAAGSQYQVLRMGAANPAYGSINLDQSAAVTGALPIGNGGTGQATKAAAFDALSPMTTAGDLIYGGASGTGTRLAAVATGSVLISQGTSTAPVWGVVPVRSQGTVSTYSASSTFTTPSNSSTATVYKYTIVGAGGGGGGTNGAAASGGGGGAGGIAIGTFTGVAASTGITVTVGAAGAAGTSSGGGGGTGGSTSLGSPVSVTVTGGVGGAGSTSAVTSGSEGGAGGGVSAGSPLVSVTGGPGGRGWWYSVGAIGIGGYGANGMFGGGATGASNSVSQSPTAATGFGAGGGGAVLATTAGSAGTVGLVIIEQLTP